MQLILNTWSLNQFSGFVVGCLLANGFIFLLFLRFNDRIKIRKHGLVKRNGKS